MGEGEIGLYHENRPGKEPQRRDESTETLPEFPKSVVTKTFKTLAHLSLTPPPDRKWEIETYR